jgi:hypothetical protein
VDVSQSADEEEENMGKPGGKGVLLFRYPPGEDEPDRLPLTDLDEQTLRPGSGSTTRSSISASSE